MNQYIQILVSLVVGIGSSVITSFINYKNAKTPNRENIAKNLLENFFAPNSEELELVLYHKLDNEIKQKLIDLRNNYKKQLSYFSSDFTIDLRIITEQNDNKLKEVQNNFDSFSMIYLKTLNETRTTLGLPKLSIQFRIRNELFKDPKTAKRLNSIQKYIVLLLLISFITFMTTLLFYNDSFKNIPYLYNILPFSLIISLAVLILSAIFLYLLNEFFKY
ncbi:hypothetical protein LL14B4_01350 [Lactococcus lactis subsp. lactis]|uniref:Uncharacterized protein n=1 Tax=Lactococcus lactis subsp. lactis TaxID=1360 RepID=A0A336UYS1_LACLL|nr:hypothetical protein [Lactococcus lactis]AWN64906.1 hypothetical protein LL14B4_01350 [Lactococcus lactis subsp. lactis]